jgi:penicillin-insensitive murein endopeptidase
MPSSGKGYRVPQHWRDRNNQYGTEELVDAIQRAAEGVRGKDRRVQLGVADLSPIRGGKSIWHKSHQSGRDVDLIFYSVNEKRRPMKPPTKQMVHYDKKGKAFEPETMKDPYKEEGWEVRRFDPKRNWLLVEELLSNPEVRVQWIFVANHLRSKMINWAEKNDRPRWLIEYGRTVVRQPLKAAPHDDHMHVRIYCPRADRDFGCQDSGVVWQHEKKTIKYDGPERYDPVYWRQVLAMPLFFPML